MLLVQVAQLTAPLDMLLGTRRIDLSTTINISVWLVLSLRQIVVDNFGSFFSIGDSSSFL